MDAYKKKLKKNCKIRKKSVIKIKKLKSYLILTDSYIDT